MGKNTSRGSTGISVRTTSLDKSSLFKMFADDTSLISKVKDPSLSLSDLNYDLETINQLAHQWKVSFNPDPNKQAKVIFSQSKL